MTRWLAIAVVVLAAAGPATAQPDTEIVGTRGIDSCPPRPDVPEARLRRLPGEHYGRGVVLYEQGDYRGAADEFVHAYCLAPCFGVLKDIGQAFERLLDYETAIAYYERFVRTMPEPGEPGACRAVVVGEKATISTRISTLRNTPAQIQVATTPTGATVTLFDENTGVRSVGTAGGKIIEATAGTYTMTVELEGYQPQTQQITVRIGKPYSFFFPLELLRGRLKIRTTPPDARILLDGKLVGQGIYDEDLPRGAYEVVVEARGRISDRRRVEVAAGITTEQPIELPPPRENGRLQLVVASGVAGATLGGVGLSAGSTNPLVLGVGSLGAAIAAVAGGYFGIPDDYPLGSSSFIITSSLAGMGEAYLITRLFSDDAELSAATASIGVIAGGTAAALTADWFDLSPGDAALLNTGALWGTVVGALFAASYDDGTGYGSRVGVGMTLTGLNVGILGGVLLGRSYEISRRHAALIDLAGVAGAASAAALQSVIDTNEVDIPAERRANFAIGGVTLGLLAGAFLTRNMDAPKIPRFKPTVMPIKDAAGTTQMGIGIVGDL
jgi:tetratricopeptide (TPR) repeat protein